MRVMLKARIPVERGNEAIRDGTLFNVIESLMADLKPEAAYFYAHEGQRAAHFVFDLRDPSQIPAIAEPLFLALGADVEIVPVMTLDDLKRAGSSIEQAVRRYGAH